MSKTLLEFEGKFIDVYKIRSIETFERWNDKLLTMEYTIEFNTPYNEGFGTERPYTFAYATEDLRDNKMEILHEVLESNEIINVIRTS